MDLRQLRYFVTVAEHLSFTEAAKRLYVTQQGLSKQISELEEQLGVKLFERNKRSVRLTAAGAELLKEANDLLEKSEKVIQKTRQVASGLTGTLRVGFRGQLEKNFMPELLRKFCRTYPHIDLTLTKLDWDSMNNALNREDIDIAFTMSLGLENIPTLVWETISPGVLHVLLPQEHPLADKKIIDIALLASERFISPSREEYRPAFDRVLRLCSDHGFSPRIVRQTPHLETVLLSVEAGLGISILSSHVESLVSSHLRLVDIEEDEELDVVVAWKKDSPNPSIPLFLKEIKSI